MMKSFYNERWKEVVFEGEYTNKFGLQVSDYGRVRSIDSITGKPVKILTCSQQEGYIIIRKKLFTPQPPSVKKKLDAMRKEIAALAPELAALKGRQYEEAKQQLKEARRKYTLAMNSDNKKRSINISLLVHRVVAEFWCQKHSDGQRFVTHKDFNKTNNHYSNLQWATREENMAHQQLSPNVIAEKARRRAETGSTSGNRKLTVTRVMLIKKRLLEGRTMRQLAKQFKVTETQIARIKKGENWASVPAAS